MAYVTVGSALVSEFIVRQPVRFPRMGPYRQSNTHQRLISIFTDSEEKKLRKLLSEVELIDRKPSALLNEMQRLGDRAEQLFYEIMEASISTGGLDNPEGISKIAAIQILTAFTKGLPHDTRIIVKARKPSDLNEAVQIAIEEETSRLSQKEMRKNNHQKVDNKYKSNQNHPASSHSKSMGACFLCGRTNHQARQCRASEADKIRYKESNQKGKTEQRDIKTITCRYCKKPNHTLEECHKRKYVNEKKEQEKQASASGNESTPGPSGGRPVGQMKIATLNLQGFSFSKQN
ncbi:hypothetical protein QTP88_020050 [Uroleucon formosanum]